MTTIFRMPAIFAKPGGEDIVLGDRAIPQAFVSLIRPAGWYSHAASATEGRSQRAFVDIIEGHASADAARE
jgi:hypothetical protein